MTASSQILYVHSGNIYGGVETVLSTLARMRGECREMETTIALCFDGKLKQELLKAGAAVHNLGPVRFRLPWTVWQARRRLRELLYRQAFDAVVFPSCWSLVLFGRSAKRLGLPIVFWAHEIPHGRHWLERKSRNVKPDLVLANSEATRAAMPSLFPGVRTVIQRPFACLEPIPDRELARQQVRNELSTPLNVIAVLIASRLDPLKGHGVLFEGLARLAKAPAWCCWVAGGAQTSAEREYFNKLIRQVKDAGLVERVRFLGQRHDITRLMAAADIYCQPNVEAESFGLTFVEAMIAGLPIVTTAIGGALEILDSTCARFVPARNPESLAQAIIELIHDGGLRVGLGQVGARRAAQQFDVGTAIRSMHDHLSALCVAEPGVNA